jgi:hypothetical protein
MRSFPRNISDTGSMPSFTRLIRFGSAEDRGIYFADLGAELSNRHPRDHFSEPTPLSMTF